jgi:hypothetical protein
MMEENTVGNQSGKPIRELLVTVQQLKQFLSGQSICVWEMGEVPAVIFAGPIGVWEELVNHRLAISGQEKTCHIRPGKLGAIQPIAQPEAIRFELQEVMTESPNDQHHQPEAAQTNLEPTPPDPIENHPNPNHDENDQGQNSKPIEARSRVKPA